MNVITPSFEVGYNNVPWTYRSAAADRFYLHVTVGREILSAREEAIKAAKEIADHFHGERITVLYSGGRDSDIVLEAFRQAKADVVALMVRSTTGLNDVELRNASEFEVRTGFDRFEMVEIDHRNYIASDEYRSLLTDVQCPYSSFLWYWGGILGRRDGVFVTGVMEPAFALTKGAWVVAMPEYEYSVYKLYDKRGIKGVPSFFGWSGELWASFFMTDVYWSCIKNKRTSVTNSNQIKGVMLERYFGHKNRRKSILHNDPSFWVDFSLGGRDVYVKDVNSWMREVLGNVSEGVAEHR